MVDRKSLRAVTTSVTKLVLAMVVLLHAGSVTAEAKTYGGSTLFVWGVSAHAEWAVVEGAYVTRYAAHAVRFISDVYPGEVHTDVGVLRRRCPLIKFKTDDCQFRPMHGVDSDVDLWWDPTLSEARLTFTYRGQTHTVNWRGYGDHGLAPAVHVPPGLAGAQAFVSRKASAYGEIYGDRVGRKSLIQSETFMWEGGFVWKWV